MPGQTDFKLGMSEGLDLIEGGAAAGLGGVAAYAVFTAVSAMPGNFFNTNPLIVTPMAVVASALIFVGLVVNRIRGRHNV
jgi:hypothetical protein